MSRTERDACPGALRVHAAADGGLARVRVPGGALTPEQFRALGSAAAELADGTLELTSRANFQVRGLAAGAEHELAERLSQAGLLPSVTHERVRNIIASPYGNGLLDARAVAGEIDRILCATPRLAELSGRFLFAVDDGSADVIALRPDVGLFALEPDVVALVLAGRDSCARSTPDAAAGLAIAAAEAFLDLRAGQEWRMSELADAGRVAARLGPTGEPVEVPATPPATHAQVGAVFERDGRVTAAVGAPLGRLSRRQVDIITAASEAAGGLRPTPWRTLVLPGLPVAAAARWLSELDANGLVVDPSAAAAGVTACTGRPGCAKALADVRADARRVPAGDLPVHWSGCARRCGRPQGRVVEVLATEAGYEVDGEFRTSDEVPAALGAARRKR
ncbi:precorrin-3B synthase [Saccharopolyspora taberi]|uniref:Precorrin-3B synthase n=1 Tax=Saccharopolyspora taberi TaxID=60895 RepID=A0ABN3VPA8_9PSEU